MARFHLLNVSLLFLCVIYSVAYDDKKALTKSSGLTARAALVDQWINVTRLPREGDISSKLFGECTTKSRRVEYKPSSVVSPSTNFTYLRFELAQYGKYSSPSTWDKVLNVADIFGCADAAADYRLFRFEGNKCSLSNMTFLREFVVLETNYGQPEGNKDVIFINFDVPESSQVGNGVFINGTNGPYVNIVEFGTPVVGFLLDSIPNVCTMQYRSRIFVDTDALPFSTLQNYLRTKKITGEFAVDAFMKKSIPRVVWNDISYRPVDPSFLDANIYRGFESNVQNVISSDHDYKIVGKDFTSEIRGVICAQTDVI